MTDTRNMVAIFSNRRHRQSARRTKRKIAREVVNHPSKKSREGNVKYIFGKKKRGVVAIIQVHLRRSERILVKSQEMPVSVSQSKPTLNSCIAPRMSLWMQDGHANVCHVAISEQQSLPSIATCTRTPHTLKSCETQSIDGRIQCNYRERLTKAHPNT